MRDVTMLPALAVEDEEREIDLDSVVLSVLLSLGTSYLSARRSDSRRSPARK
jgi:hypothetical protein